jgi:hypothetical protein
LLEEVAVTPAFKDTDAHLMRQPFRILFDGTMSNDNDVETDEDMAAKAIARQRRGTASASPPGATLVCLKISKTT